MREPDEHRGDDKEGEVDQETARTLGVDEVRVRWPGLPTEELFGPLASQSIHRLVQGRGHAAPR